jgi:hypothetical protein
MTAWGLKTSRSLMAQVMAQARILLNSEEFEQRGPGCRRNNNYIVARGFAAHNRKDGSSRVGAAQGRPQACSSCTHLR